MAFDPIQEDCLRLILQSMRREGIFPLDDASFIEHGMEQFRTDPSKLITCDADRSFHLMAKATEILDYRLPFLTDEVQVDRQEMQAENYLREAVDLDARIVSYNVDAYLSGQLETIDADYLRTLNGGEEALSRLE